MDFDDYKDMLIGNEIISSCYGLGIISDIYLSDYNIMISIDFDCNSQLMKKLFNFVNAINANSIYFKDKALNQIFVALVEYVKNMPKVQMNYSHIEEKSVNLQNNKDRYQIIVEKLSKLIIEEKSIALELIDFYDNQEFESKLYEIGFNYLIKVINDSFLKKETYSRIILLLSYIALKKYDGALHDYIYQEFKSFKPNSIYTKNQVINGSYKALRDYKKVVKYFDESSYIAVPIILSCVPHYRLEDLFKFSFDIYKKKLLYDDDLDDNSIYKNVYETLIQLRENEIVGNEDILKIKGSEYLMSKFTQSCIYSGKCLDSLSAIITNCIRYIINYLTKREDSFVIKSYYLDAYKSFIDYFENSNNGKERDRYENNNIISRPYFKFINNKVFLVTGELMIDDSYDTENIYMVIYNAEDEIRRIQLNEIGDIVAATDDSFAKNKIARKTIEIKSNVLDYFSYSFICGDVELYNSKKRLYRENIFFNGKGVEVKPGLDYNGAIRVLSKNSNKNEYGDDINELFINNCFYSSIVEVNNKDIFRFDNIPYVFYKISEPRLVGYQVPWASFISYELKEYLIYKDMSIIFQASCEASDIKIEINGDLVPSEKNGKNNYELYLYSRENNDYNTYKIVINCIPYGYNCIKIYNGISNKIIKNCEFSFLFDDSMEKIHISNNANGNTYYLTTRLLKEPIEFEFPYGYSYKKYDAFAKNIGLGELMIFASVISYSSDGSNWFDLDKRFYLFNIPNDKKTIKICGPNNMKAYYYDKSNNKQQAVLIRSDNQFIYDLEIDGFRKIANYQKIKIYFEFGNKIKYLFIWLIPFIEKEYTHFYDKKEKKHYFKIKFDGANKIHYRIKPLNQNNILLEGDASNDEIFDISDEMIPSGIKYLSISLHKKKSGSLFSKYEEEPFYTFPKYHLRGLDVKFLDKPCFYYEINNYSLEASVSINIDICLKIEVIDNLYNNVVFVGTINNNQKLKIDLRKELFDSYIVKYYSPLDLECSEFIDVPVYVSKPIKVKPWYKNKFFLIDRIDLEDDVLKVEYLLNFKKFEINNNEVYLIGIIINKYGKELFTDVWCKKVNIDNNSENLKILVYREDKFYYLKLDNKKIKSIHILSGGKK